MSIEDIKAALHEDIDNGDDKLLKMVYALVKEYNSDSYPISAERLHLVREERERYLRGEGRSYTWEEVKEIARSKKLSNIGESENANQSY